MKKSVIKIGSIVSYVSYERGFKSCGIGIVREIDRELKTCLVSDYGQLYLCFLDNCENTCNW